MKHILAASFEAMDLQQDTIFFDLITQHVNRIRKAKSFSPSGKETKDLIALINHKTKLKYFITYVEDRSINGMVLVPSLSRNHPLINRQQQSIISGFQADKLFNKDNPVEGTVDRKKGTVGGVFTTIDVEMLLTTGLMSSTNVSDDEVAALIMHEIGHVMGYFEAFGTMARANPIMAAVSQRYVEADNEKLKIELIDATNKHLGLDLDHSDLVNYSTSDAVHAVMLTRHAESLRSTLGVNYYDYRNFEAVADQYAGRMGAGRSLVTLLSKLHRRGPSTYSTGMYLFMETLKLIAVLAVGVINPFFLVALLVGYDPTVKIYDPPEQRMRRIRHTLVEATKDRTLSKARKETIAKDIDVVDTALKEYNDRREFYEILYTSLLPNLRNQTKRLKAQQQLESLANNELFVKSMKLSLI